MIKREVRFRHLDMSKNFLTYLHDWSFSCVKEWKEEFMIPWRWLSITNALDLKVFVETSNVSSKFPATGFMKKVWFSWTLTFILCKNLNTSLCKISNFFPDISFLIVLYAPSLILCSKYFLAHRLLTYPFAAIWRNLDYSK